MGKIITPALPHDLPENWTDNQYVSPGGTEAGLTPQHGFNYLMRQVNNAQKAINELDQGAVSKQGGDMSGPIGFRGVATMDASSTSEFNAAWMRAHNRSNNGYAMLVIFCDDSHVGGEAFVQKFSSDGKLISSDKIIHMGNLDEITPQLIGAVSREEWQASLLTNAVLE